MYFHTHLPIEFREHKIRVYGYTISNMKLIDKRRSYILPRWPSKFRYLVPKSPKLISRVAFSRVGFQEEFPIVIYTPLVQISQFIEYDM